MGSQLQKGTRKNTENKGMVAMQISVLPVYDVKSFWRFREIPVFLRQRERQPYKQSFPL